MKRVKSSVKAASGEGDSKLQEMMDAIKSDFEYILAGLEKLERTGASEANDGLIIAEGLQDNLQSAVAEIASKLS